MMIHRTLKILAILLLVFGVSVPRGFAAFDPIGEDIDIFLANPNYAAVRPNVLILLDNTANWNTAFANEKAALVSVVNSLTEEYNVGLMMFAETGGGNDNVDGGYVRFAVRQMTGANRTALASMVNNLDVNGDKSNNSTPSLLMYEAYAYFAGISSRAGHGKVKRDFAGNTANNTYAANLPGNAFTSAASTTYVSPIVDGCQKNFIIFISNGPHNENNSSLSAAQSLLSGIVGKSPPDTISITPNGQQGNWMDEYAKFMANGDCNANFAGVQTVTTYTVEIDRTTGGQGPATTALMKSAAINGKGKYFDISSANGGKAIVDTLQQIFSEVQSVNSVFASTTLPVSVNVRGTNLNQVYIGVFRPDAQKSPRWLGNLKLYDLNVDSATGSLFLNDANDAPAANSSTGFITNSAKSFWTTPSTFWSYRSPYESTDLGGPSDDPDGDLVEKGGAAQRLRVNFATDQATRNLYTCIGCATNSLLSDSKFENANTAITAGLLGTLLTKTVTALTSAGTTATATVTAHGYATGDTVQIAGASPGLYNGTYVITVTGANTFTYTLAGNPAGTTASASATAHNLSTNDLVDISGSTDAGYNVSGAVVNRIDANSFSYTLSAAVSGPSSGHTVVGRKLVQTLSGFGTTATVTLPSHGYTAGNQITISGALPGEFNVANATISGVTTDSFTYTTSGGLSGNSSTGRATATGHGFSSGDTVGISCATPLDYNATGVITVLDSNNFTYTLLSSQAVNATHTTAPTGCAGTTSIVATKAGTTLNAAASNPITHANNSNTATFNASAAHGFSAGQVVTIAGANQSIYNGAVTIVSVPSTTSFTYTKLNVGSATTPLSPSAATAVVGANSRSISTISHPTSGNQAARDVATVTTSAAHGFTTGQSVTISGTGTTAYDGTWTIASTPSTTTFTFSNSGVQGAATPATGTITVSGSVVRSVSSLSRSIVATGTIYAGRTVTTTSITSQTNATGTITAANTTSGDATARTALINWVRGQDNLEDENSNGSATDVRASVHGDVLHSRPAVINYNRGGANGSNTGDNDIFVFYGGNDGILHAVQGGFAANGGNEAWGFVAQEHFGKLKRLRDNSPIVSSTNTRDYFFDGSIGVYTLDVNSDGKLLASSGDKVWLFASMRRGGRYIYALDASDPNAPKFMWKKGCPNISNNIGCDPGFEELGQTWSEPKVAFLRAYANPVLIFGAGYDPKVEDFQPCLITAMPPDPATPLGAPTSVTAQTGGSVTYTSTGTCTYSGTTPVTVNRSMGRGVFILDATNGSLLYRFGPDAGANKQVAAMQYAIPADLVVLNRDRDNTRALPGRENLQPLLSGYADRIYAVDTGGNVWRLDVDSANPVNWVVTQLAALSTSTLANKRKFLFPPDVVYANDSLGNYDAVLVGSGDREHPFDSTITNRFYMLKDRKTGLDATGQATINDNDYNTATNVNGLFDATSNCLQDAAVCATGSAALTTAQANLLNSRGWKLTLAAGEKNVGTATTVAGTTFFNTNQPSASAGGGSCGSNLGIARQYQIAYQNATAVTDLNAVGGITGADRFATVAGGGYLPSPVPLIVEIGGNKYQAVISGTQVQTPGGLKLEARIRSYWYRKFD